MVVMGMEGVVFRMTVILMTSILIRKVKFQHGKRREEENMVKMVTEDMVKMGTEDMEETIQKSIQKTIIRIMAMTGKMERAGTITPKTKMVEKVEILKRQKGQRRVGWL